MTMEFTVPSNKTTEKIVREAQSFQEMVEGLKQAAGRHSDYWEVPVAAPQPSREQVIASLTTKNAGDEDCRFCYPYKNERYELWGKNEQELDEKQKQLESLYR